MSKEKEASLEDVNESFLYRGNDIVKLWEQYLKSLDADLKFYLDSEHTLASIFTRITQNHEVALVLNPNNSPYLNKDENSLTLCGEVNYAGANNIDGTNSIKNKLFASITQIKSYNNTHDTKIINHVIIFPYHAGPLHWNLGKIELVFAENSSIVEAYIDIYEPFGGEASGYDNLIKDINSLDEFELIKISKKESLTKQIKQQYDGTSCGAITAENGKEFLKDKADGANLLESIYQTGANKLRLQHINEIGEEDFFVAQRDNIAYEVTGDKPIDNQDEIIKALEELIQKPENDWIKQVILLIQKSEEDEIIRKNLDLFKQFLIQIDLSSNTIFKISSEILKLNSEFREGGLDLIKKLNAHNIKESYSSNKGNKLLENQQIDLRFDISQPFTADGLRKTLHGNVYQLGLLTLAALRAQAKKLEFYLISEAQEFEKFDDLVIDYGDKITYLQAKHSSSEGANYSKKDFCGDYENDASLAKYFDSWFKLRNAKYSKSKKAGEEKITQYIFFINKGVKDANTFLEEAKLDDDEFLFKDLRTKTYSIKSDKEIRSELIDAIITSSKEVQSNSVGNSLDQINFDLLQSETKKVKKYLEQKFNEQNGKTPKEIKIDGRSNLSKKELALIKLAKEEESVAEKVLGKQTKVIKWLQQHKQIVVNISNPLDVLAPKMTLEINKFLDELIIKIEQPNSNDLAQIILKELGTNISTIGTKELNSALYSYMWEWFSKRSECLLKSEDFGKFVQVTNGDLHRFYLLEGTRVYKEECQSDVVGSRQFALVDGLSDFLTGKTKDSDKSIALFKDKGGGIKLQIYSIITSMDSLKDDEWSFLHLSNTNMNLLPQILRGKSAKFYIVDCRSEEIDESHSAQLQTICQTVIENQKKLILLISDEQGELLNRLLISEGNSSKFVEFESQPLTDKQIRDICSSYSDKYVSLAGKEYRIQDIITNKIGGMYELMSDAKYLVQLIESSYGEIQEFESEMPYGVYVSNQMRKGEGYYDLSIITKKTANCYIVEGADYRELGNQLRGLFKDTSEKRLSIGSKNITEETEFVLLRNANDLDKYESQIIILTEKPSSEKLKERTYISLKILDNEQFQIAENPNNLYLPFPEGIDFSNKDEQGQFIQTIISGNQLSVLMSPAGYGKTSFCKNIVEKYKSSDANFSPVWIIKIPLPKLQFDVKSCPILTPFIVMDYEWQRVVWETDTKVPGRIFIILDGFDEIKNIETVKLINQWISTIPPSISLLITTREYAANKLVLPTDRNTTFYKLTEYTEEQRKEYIKKYIKAILEETDETKEFSIFIEHITEKIKSKVNSHSSGVLGIPLESYIFCELLRPHILTHVKQHSYRLQEDSIDVLKDIDVSNVAKLYQEFILSKSGLFLEKHLGINPENIVKKSILFNIMGSYNQIIELYALMQAFDLYDRHEIEKYISSINFDINELKTLEDTGLLRVSKDGSKLNFNHETYQEFYAALAIIRGILSDKGELHEIVKSLVREHRYDTKFYFIFSVASQFSISAGAMVPGYNIEKHLLSFWNLLGEDGDVLGAGAINLFKRCVSEFTSAERDILLSKIEGKKWIKFLKVAVSRCEDEYKELQIHDEQDRLPISSQQDEEDLDRDVNEQISTSKDLVAGVFRRLRKKEALDQEKVKLLEVEAEQHKTEGDYWALDGGIDAIGCSGRFFSKNLADYLILRALQWENNKKLVIQALISICRDLGVNKDYNPARINCFFVVKSLLKNELWQNNEDLLLKLLYVVDNEFLDHLIDDLSELLSTDIKIDEVKLSDPTSIFKSPFEIMKILLLVAEKLEYAILINESKNQITLVKDTKIEIQFDESAFSQIFANLMLSILRNKFDSDETKSCTSAISLDDTNELCLQKIEAFIVVQLKNEELFDKLFDSVKEDGTNLIDLYKKLFEYKSITKHSIDKYIAELKTSKAIEKGGYYGPWWSLHGGIEIAGYTGLHFNQDIAKFLQLRAEFWPDNKKKVVIALKCIYDALTGSNIDKLQKNYTIAVNAYNECIQNIHCSELESIKLDMPVNEDNLIITKASSQDILLEEERSPLGDIEEQF